MPIPSTTAQRARTIAVIIGVAAFSYLVATIFRQSPREQYLTTQSHEEATESVLSPAGLICRSHYAIARLQPSSPEHSTTLLSILNLDASEPPFYPPDDCAYPFSPNYKEAKEKVSLAWEQVSGAYDGGMREWRDAFALAAMTLLNDTSRVVYLKEVLPKITGKGRSVETWQTICNRVKLL
ncbi:hypothetical protein G7046_g5385 [Stylonectria norvegica]|nr:hypothetical protein G7046_g5385 [Stylonectria norvegica]